MNKLDAKFSIIAAMILVAALSRIIPHPYNFTPVMAMGLFAGANFKKSWQAYLVPIAAFFISDLFFAAIGKTGFYGVTQLFVYGAMMLVTALGTTMNNRRTALKILGYTLSGSAIFWILSNFGVWAAGRFSGVEPGLSLGFTYLRALPFYNMYSNELFFGAILGDLFYSCLLFGGYALLQKKYTFLRLA